MKCYASVDEAGRICVTTPYEEYADESYLQIDFPDDFDFGRQGEYRVEDGVLVHDPLPPTEEEIEAKRAVETDRQTRIAAVMYVRSQASTIDDEQAASVNLLFEGWASGVVYEKDDVRRYDNRLWRCAQSHTSQDGWEPPNAASLWYEIAYGADGILVWRQPTGAHDAPNKGDLRHYPDADGPVYVSKRDGNTSVPGADEWWEPVDR